MKPLTTLLKVRSTMNSLLFYLARCILSQIFADMVKLADTSDLGSDAERCAGSSPVIRTRAKAQS